MPLGPSPAPRPGDQKISHCHRRVRDVAIGLAEQNYDELMSNDWVYRNWKLKHPGAGPKALRKLFVSANWGRYVPAARATLVLLLRSPIDDILKEEIVDVLALDSTLVRGRLNPAVLAGTVASKT